MNVKKAELETVCGPTSKLPENLLPEMAFAGRSNVGKSSMLNVLINRKSLARTSSQPGKTQTINFYNINDELYFVDLPGYGYAKASKKEQEKWGIIIEEYLQTSKQLKTIFLLIDIRHGPKESDRQMYEWVTYNGFEPVIIATKADKIKKNAISKQLKLIRDEFGVEKGEDISIIPFSAETKSGKEEIWNKIEELLK